MEGPFVILTGASGVGKTSIAFAVEEQYPEVTVFRGDSAGVPSAEVMASYGPGYKPGGAWQRAFALQWMERIAPVLTSGSPVLFEAQMRIAFIQEALALQDICHARVLLVECDDATRESRLIHARRQPELANESMRGWSQYLHKEAVEAGYETPEHECPLPLRECAARSFLSLAGRVARLLAGEHMRPKR